MFRNASNLFDEEIVKRDILIRNMSKKLMIINYTNEFIENKLMALNGSTNDNNKLVAFTNDLGGSYNQYGYTVHPKFKKEPIDIFNLKLTSGNTMFKNSLSCKVNDVDMNPDDEENYVNFLMADNSVEKKIIFQELKSEKLKIEYTLDNKTALGTSRFNVIEIDPYIYGAYSIDFIEIFSLNEYNGEVSKQPIKTVYSISNIGKIRIILDEKVKFSSVAFHFDLKNVKTQINNIDIYPFGLKHIHFYEADFLEESHVVLPIRANDYIEYIYNDITLYQAGNPIMTTCEFYNIEFYTDFINNTLTGKVYTSSDAQAYRIAKNTKVLYAKIPLIWVNEATKDKQYLSLSGILFNYTVDENIFI
jgi:hypothetical protein